MFLRNDIITFKGMPLFQKARFQNPSTLQGALENVACFFYVVEGTMKSMDSRGLHQIKNKEGLVKNCGNYIQQFLHPDSTKPCEAIAVYLHRDILLEIYKDEVPYFLKKDGNKAPEKFVSNELIDQYMANLFIYFDNPGIFDEKLAVIKLKELVLILLKSERYQDVQNMLSQMFSSLSVEFKQSVENNLFNNLSLEKLAYICNVSLSTFKREFKKVYNESPARYIKKRRLEHAASLLLSTSDPVSAIAFDSGFQDVSTFSANFQEYYQTSPSKYRLGQTRK